MTGRTTTDRPQILVVSQPYPFPTVDGFTVRVADQSRALAESCDLHFLVTREPRESLPPHPAVASVTSVDGNLRRPTLPGRVWRRAFPPHFDHSMYVPRAVLDAAKKLDTQHQFDACIVHTPLWAGVFGALSSKALRIIDAHDIWFEKYCAFRELGKGRLLQQFRSRERELATYRAADLTLAISTRDDEILATGGVENRLHVPVSFPIQDLGPAPTEPTLLYAASSGETNRDAIDAFLADVLPRVRAEIPEARLLLMGGGSEIRERYSGVEGVEVLPFLDDVDDAYRRARVVVVPLRQGTGLKIKVLESLSRGIPTILSPVAAEGIRLERYAQPEFVPPGAEFADQVLRALRDESFRSALAESGPAVVAEHYSPEKTYGALIERIVSHRQAANEERENASRPPAPLPDPRKPDLTTAELPASR